MPDCPYCETDLDLNYIRTLALDMSREDRYRLRGSLASSLRNTLSHGEGRPKDTTKPRCPCGCGHTYKRGVARVHKINGKSVKLFAPLPPLKAKKKQPQKGAE